MHRRHARTRRPGRSARCRRKCSVPCAPSTTRRSAPACTTGGDDPSTPVTPPASFEAGGAASALVPRLAGRTVVAVTALVTVRSTAAGTSLVASAVTVSPTPVVVARHTTPRNTAVGPDLDQSARDARVAQPVEYRRIQVHRQLDDREVRLDRDRAEVVATQPALVRQRADDLARLHAVATADLDPVRRVVATTTALARSALRPILPFARRPVVALHGLGELIPFGVEQQGSVTLRHDRQRGGHI